MVLTSRGEASALAVLVHRVDDPVDTGVVADGHVLGINKDNLEVLVGGVLVNPVRVQHTHVGGVAASALLSNRADVAGKLELVDTLVLGLSVYNASRVDSLAASSANGNTKDGVSLLGLVSELVGLVGTGRTSHLGDLLGLTVLPCSIILNLLF